MSVCVLLYVCLCSRPWFLPAVDVLPLAAGSKAGAFGNPPLAMAISACIPAVQSRAPHPPLLN